MNDELIKMLHHCIHLLETKQCDAAAPSVDPEAESLYKAIRFGAHSEQEIICEIQAYGQRMYDRGFDEAFPGNRR